MFHTTCALHPGYFVSQNERHAFLGEDFCDDLTHFLVFARENPIGHLDHGDLGTKAGKHLCQLDADGTGSENHKGAGHLLEGEHLDVGDESGFGLAGYWRYGWAGACCQDDLLCLKFPARYTDSIRIEHRGLTLDNVDPHVLEPCGIVMLSDGIASLSHAGHDGCKIEFRLRGRKPEFCRMSQIGDEPGRSDQGLAWNTPSPQTFTAESVPFDQANLRSESCGSRSHGKSGGSAAYHDDVKTFVHVDVVSLK